MNKMLPALFGMVLGLAVGCSDDSSVPQDTGTGSDLSSQVEAGADAVTPDQGAGGDAASCDPASLAEEAMNSGKKIFNGVSLATSTPIADILADASQHEGQVRRIEGFIATVCSSQGCYVALDDGTGKQINLKVVDGAIDLRDYATVGQYAIGEGVYTASGGHGPQVDIMNHGAMIGNVVCSL